MLSRLTAKQLISSVSAFIIASSLLTSNLYYFAQNDSWLSVIMGFGVSVVMVGIYATLSKHYPGLNLVEINDAVFGIVPGKIITLLYTFYFLSLSFLNTRDLGVFVNSFVLPHTPFIVVIIAFVFLCSRAVAKGPASILGYGFILSFIAIFAILLNSVLMINIVQPNNLLPAFSVPVKKLLIGSHIVTMLPFSEIMSFMMFIPFMKKNERFGQSMRRGLYLGAGVLLFVVFRDILVLGPFIAIFTMPTFSTVRYIDIGDILTRLDVVYAVILMSLLFFKVTVVYFSTVSCVQHVFKMKSYRPLLSIVGALILLYALSTFSSLSEHVKWNLSAAATYSTFFLLLLPFTTLIVSCFKKGRLKRKTINQEIT